MTVNGPQLQHLWTAVSAQPATKAFRTAEIGVDSIRGPLLAAVDRSGRRALLVPILTKQTLQEDLDGQAVVLRRRTLEDEQSYRTYACLELVDANQADLFTALCVEIIERVAAHPDKAVAALRKVLSDWKALLAGARETLSPSALAGLFGELYVLREMLGQDPGAVTFWTGPQRTAQDFHLGVDAVEVKTTVAAEGRRVQINGATQLELATPGRLILRWFRLRTGQGISVPALIDEIMELSDDPPGFKKLLQEYGYREPEREIYARQLFEVLEHRAYEIGPAFPRIVAASFVGHAVPTGVEDIVYVVDLDCAPAAAARLDSEELAQFMRQS
ncbi:MULTISPECIES: PD-(D/E)XK motif protein [Rhodococcus]|uniref:PD-(D/E)XK motif protein n=1 Tax=Rhodococcus TaxID=1827 RepID=UPI001E3437B6|nr:PD-(D/E)XK motif protein [Rhodococcus pyridinivorans]MCD2116731.1 PD-(D/E)XK motif protein [Rhodococcus pyridinivorans]MCZ4625325.1 PD-(D/E)XK motif protein [Rhodococcus pyridinivorans]MCZ4646535.1 PD-(D/E)XK motif protein [Rhodococcus pyridinivorans]MDJ0482373.1 PD-(D/E)XK motif protein [Rhodococcus pyridinivorans]MDV7252912.1 PD-(D/E)XK motif protein [Rhodococcus pyridinivorans]